MPLSTFIPFSPDFAWITTFLITCPVGLILFVSKIFSLYPQTRCKMNRSLHSPHLSANLYLVFLIWTALKPFQARASNLSTFLNPLSPSSYLPNHVEHPPLLCSCFSLHKSEEYISALFLCIICVSFLQRLHCFCKTSCPSITHFQPPSFETS